MLEAWVINYDRNTSIVQTTCYQSTFNKGLYDKRVTFVIYDRNHCGLNCKHDYDHN